VVLFVVSLLLLATGDPGPGIFGVFLWLAAIAFAVVNVVVVVALSVVGGLADAWRRHGACSPSGSSSRFGSSR
jgi:hypothetical protein